MQLVFHTGAHFTEEERLLQCLLRNVATLSERGVVVPGPERYRKLLRDTVVAMEDIAPAPDARKEVLGAILDDAHADRALLSVKHLFGVPRAALRKGHLYPRAAERLSNLATVFAQDDIEIFMAVRNPATFLPACLRKSSATGMNGFLKGVDPREILWSQMLSRLRAAAPEVRITVWCNEDAPLVWSQVVREMGGLDHGDHVIGRFDLMSEIVSKEGMARFVTYLKGRPAINENQLRRVMAAFMQKYAVEDAIEQEIDIPQWTPDLVNEMTEIYEDDVIELARIPGVTLISP